MEELFFFLRKFFYKESLDTRRASIHAASRPIQSAGWGVALEPVFMRVYAVRQTRRAGPGAVSCWLSAT